MKKKKAFACLSIFSGFSLGIWYALQKYLFSRTKKTDALFTRTYAWKNGTVSYETYGTGRPVVLLHNTVVGASSVEWEKNVDKLSRTYQVFVPDLPGFGFSEKPKMTYTAYQYALFINDFISDVVKRPATVVGSSQSADFALMAYLLQPENFYKMVLISPTGVNESLPNKQDNRQRKLLEMPLLGTHAYLQASGKKAIRSLLENELFFAKEEVPPHLLDAYYTAAHTGGESARFSFASAKSDFLNANVKEAFSLLKIPFLVLWGEGNVTNPWEQMEELSALRPDGEYVLFETTRMLPHYENNPLFYETIQSFIN